MKTIVKKSENKSAHTHSFPANTSGGGDHGKSVPNAGTGQRSKNHGSGYPFTIDSIDHANPEHGVKESRNSNMHGHSYPGRALPGKGGAKNASPKPTKKSKNIVG